MTNARSVDEIMVAVRLITVIYATFFCSTAWHGGPSIETGSNIQTTICFNKNLHTLGMLANKNRTFGNTILVPPKSILDDTRCT